MLDVSHDLGMTLTLLNSLPKVKCHFYTKKQVNFKATFGNMPTSSKLLEYIIKCSKSSAFRRCNKYRGHSSDGEAMRKYVFHSFTPKMRDFEDPWNKILIKFMQFIGLTVPSIKTRTAVY